ncbi:pathogen-related protein-like [Andrographis paniculata]|uniref:pathogen-related protein-like n=1 Tax=Andrographis paniculata TaxID=175694 RepID=UPI0021E94E5E|nr:pathogen-related protein-like [Andrographis paniculata]
MASRENIAGKYRTYMIEDDEEKNIEWRFGSRPNYEAVDKLFEEGRTHVWPPGSLEEKVENIVKTWEMEMFHKVNPEDYKVVDPDKYRFSLNGREALSLVEKRKLGGGYNSLLQTSLPEKFRCFDPDEETVDSSHRAFTTAFPRGFALEVIRVYSGPPVIVYKFRHWGFMEGSFKGHPPTGEMVEFFGMSVFELDENSKVVKVEFFYDRGELLGALVKGDKIDGGVDVDVSRSSCPVLKNTG